MKKIEIEDCDFWTVKGVFFQFFVEKWIQSGLDIKLETPVYLEDVTTGERTAMESIELIDGEIIIKHQ